MSRADLLADVLTRIRNGQSAGYGFVIANSSKFVKSVLSVMLAEGYIGAFEEFVERQGVNMLKIDLKYYKNKPVIEKIKRISKSGRRYYSSVDEVKKVRGGLGIAIVSTSKGVISDIEARKNGVGGEILCEVY